MLPWVYHRREEQPGWLECETCLDLAPPSVRASYNCPLLDPSERTGPGFRSTHLPIDTELCPGWLVQLPQANEAVRASGWAKDGLLNEFLDGVRPTRLLFDCMDIFRSSVSELEAYVVKGKKSG